MLLTLIILINIASLVWIAFDLFKIIKEHQSRNRIFVPIVIFIIALAAAFTINNENKQAANNHMAISASTKATMLVMQNELSPLKKLNDVNSITVINNTVIINTMTNNTNTTKQEINKLIAAVCQKLSANPATALKDGVNIEITAPDYTNSNSICMGYAHVDSNNLTKVNSNNVSSAVQQYENKGK